MALTVPSDQIESLKELLKLAPTQIDEFLKALADAEPEFNVADLADHVSKRLKLSQMVVSGLVRVLASLYLTRDREGTPTDNFIDEEILTALTNSKVFADDAALKDQWPKLRKSSPWPCLFIERLGRQPRQAIYLPSTNAFSMRHIYLRTLGQFFTSM